MVTPGERRVAREELTVEVAPGELTDQLVGSIERRKSVDEFVGRDTPETEVRREAARSVGGEVVPEGLVARHVAGEVGVDVAARRLLSSRRKIDRLGTDSVEI